MNRDTRKLTVRLPVDFIREIDFLVKVQDFPTRSEAVRTAVRDLLYTRIEMVMEKVEKKVKAKHRIAEMEALEQEYLRK
ncbi:MAG: ribbon-helix-helix protein, CopG family [Thermoplasmata archaeon]|nr:ribbon-helix-helix protein, CopG family [Thermoplasmata archaeon]